MQTVKKAVFSQEQKNLIWQFLEANVRSTAETSGQI
jgi:hypothetical protein